MTRDLHNLVRDVVRQSRLASAPAPDVRAVKKMSDRELAQRTRALRAAKKAPAA
jgi:hypothetical protein